MVSKHKYNDKHTCFHWCHVGLASEILSFLLASQTTLMSQSINIENWLFCLLKSYQKYKPVCFQIFFKDYYNTNEYIELNFTLGNLMYRTPLWWKFSKVSKNERREYLNYTNVVLIVSLTIVYYCFKNPLLSSKK